MLSPEQLKIINKQLGFPGRMLSGSKSYYEDSHPSHVTIFNANIIVAGLGKIWYGDIDITKDEEKLKELSRAFNGQTVYVLYEMDARFDNEENPLIDRAVYQTNGVSGLIGKEHLNYFYRSEDSGKIEKTPEIVERIKNRNG